MHALLNDPTTRYFVYLFTLLAVAAGGVKFDDWLARKRWSEGVRDERGG